MMDKEELHRPIRTYGTQRSVVLVKEAWKKLADFLNRDSLPEDIKIIRAHILIQTGLIEEENVNADGQA